MEKYLNKMADLFVEGKVKSEESSLTIQDKFILVIRGKIKFEEDYITITEEGIEEFINSFNSKRYEDRIKYSYVEKDSIIESKKMLDFMLLYKNEIKISKINQDLLYKGINEKEYELVGGNVRLSTNYWINNILYGENEYSEKYLWIKFMNAIKNKGYSEIYIREYLGINRAEIQEGKLTLLTVNGFNERIEYTTNFSDKILSAKDALMILYTSSNLKENVFNEITKRKLIEYGYAKIENGIYHITEIGKITIKKNDMENLKKRIINNSQFDEENKRR